MTVPPSRDGWHREPLDSQAEQWSHNALTGIFREEAVWRRLSRIMHGRLRVRDGGRCRPVEPPLDFAGWMLFDH